MPDWNWQKNKQRLSNTDKHVQETSLSVSMRLSD